MSRTTIASTSGSTRILRSSNITVPRALKFTGQCGMVCFCPLSPTPANHAPAWGRVSHSRIAGLSPFDAMTSGSPTAPSTEKFRQLPVRPGTGVARAITHRHGSHTMDDSGATTFAPSDSMPGQSHVRSPRAATRAQTTQRPAGTATASGKGGALQVCHKSHEAVGRTAGALPVMSTGTIGSVVVIGTQSDGGRASCARCARRCGAGRCPWPPCVTPRGSDARRASAGRAP